MPVIRSGITLVANPKVPISQVFRPHAGSMASRHDGAIP
jgi:hypothetical protein